MALIASTHSFMICVSIAFISAIAVANCCSNDSSAAMLSAEAASVGIGVADRAVGELADYGACIC